MIPTHEEQQHRSGGGVGEEARSEPRTCRVSVAISSYDWTRFPSLPSSPTIFFPTGQAPADTDEQHALLDGGHHSTYIHVLPESGLLSLHRAARCEWLLPLPPFLLPHHLHTSSSCSLSLPHTSSSSLSLPSYPHLCPPSSLSLPLPHTAYDQEGSRTR